ncbi:MAG: phosphatidate cytidylyltransferase [Clostridia bacterium]|nr:phosphatidate cytidylyltransferase [Clostridia bacterium]
MKKRIISGAIFLALIILIIFVDQPIVDTLIVVGLSVVGIYEYNNAFKKAGYRPISWVGYLGCLTIFTMGGLISDENKVLLTKISIPILVIAIFMYIILTNLKRSIVDVAITVFSLLYIPFMFSFIKLILMMDNSRILVWYIFMGAFATDTFAYFIGSKFGKNKLCPEISPNKTVEGSIGGIIGAVLSYILLTCIANEYFGTNINMLYIIVAGVVAGIAGQFGDLSASAIKRHCKIKDFGNLIPGHGGILDRFDSIIFVAPIVYIFLKLYLYM